MLIYILGPGETFNPDTGSYPASRHTSLDRIAVIENYESCIWTERFIDPGDFKLVAAANGANSNLLLPGVVLENEESSIPMLIETVELKDHALTVTGKTMETFFNQRMIGPSGTEASGGAGPIASRVLTDSPGRIMGAIVDIMQTQHNAGEVVYSVRAGDVQADGDIITKKIAKREKVHDLLLRIAKQYVVDMYVRRHPIDYGGYELVFSTRKGVRRVDGNPDGYATVRFSSNDDNLVDVTQVYSAVETVDVVLVYPPLRYSGPGQIGDSSGSDDHPFKIDGENINSPDGIGDFDLYYSDLFSYSATPFNTRVFYADSEKLTDAYLEKQLYRYGYAIGTTWASVPSTGVNSKRNILKREMIRMGKYEYNRTRGNRKWAIDGEVATNMFTFGRDYRLGDIVEVTGKEYFSGDGTDGTLYAPGGSGYEIFGKREAVVTEYIRSADSTGVREYPTFSEPLKEAPYDDSPEEQQDI